MKFHINPTTEKITTCSAQIACPFGENTPHFENKKLAENFLEKKYKNEEKIRPMVKSNLKEMDANSLTKGLLQNVKKLNINVEKIENAVELASILHFKQKRRNRGNHKTTPYIEHPLRVAYRMTKMGVVDENVILAGILHDTVEDGTKRFYSEIIHENYPDSENVARERMYEYLNENFSQETSEIVQSVTNDLQNPDEWKAATNKERFQIYRDHLTDNIVDKPQNLMVKLGDFIDNATGLYHNDVPGFEDKIVKMAAKYVQCVPVFEKEIVKNQNNLTENSVISLLSQMARTRLRLNNIVNKYSDRLEE